MEQNSAYMFAVENALEMILMFDKTGKIVYANTVAKKLLDYGDEIYSQSISDIFPNTFKTEKGIFETDCSFGEEFQKDRKSTV